MSLSDIMGSMENLPRMRADSMCAANKAEVHAASSDDMPAWFSKAYMEHHLREYYKDKELNIVSMDVRPALGRGENYGGILTRIKVNFVNGAGNRHTGHYILKTSFESDEFARKAMEPYDIFNREMSIYQNILPKLNALLHEIGDQEQLFADTMAVDYERSALIFEDLNVRQFVMPDRLEGLDIELTKIVLRKLAKMHATSAVLNEREGGSLECYDRGMFNRHTDNYAPCFVGMIEACSRRVAQWPGYEKYAEKLAALAPIYMELGNRVFDITQGHINVLAHGDCWTNNVLAKYDPLTGSPTDAILIDFQYVAWGSPAIDLFYLLNSSLQPELHFHHQEQLINHYYGIFAETLAKLRYLGNIPSLHRFRLQLEEKSFYAFHTTCAVAPIQRNIETTDADFNALMNTNERAINFKNTCFKNPYCHKIIKQLLPIYERRGLLEVNQ